MSVNPVEATTVSAETLVERCLDFCQAHPDVVVDFLFATNGTSNPTQHETTRGPGVILGGGPLVRTRYLEWHLVWDGATLAAPTHVRRRPNPVWHGPNGQQGRQYQQYSMGHCPIDRDTHLYAVGTNPLVVLIVVGVVVVTGMARTNKWSLQNPTLT